MANPKSSRPEIGIKEVGRVLCDATRLYLSSTARASDVEIRLDQVGRLPVYEIFVGRRRAFVVIPMSGHSVAAVDWRNLGEGEA